MAITLDPAAQALPEDDFVVISPFLVDPYTPKKVNIGDGFITDSALKLIGARPSEILSSRMAITDQQLDRINASKLLLITGANTLKFNFEITPNFTPALLDRIRVPVVLCGIGHYGVAAATSRPLDAPSQAIMREILRRFPFVSVRCDASAAYLAGSIPDLAENVLMTSCPVVYPVDGVDKGFTAKPRYDQLVVTVTDRSDVLSQLPLLLAGVGRFDANRRVLALHQNYNNQPLLGLARELGYEVFAGDGYPGFLKLYRDSDLHFGNRLHAHLKCLSYGVRSFLTPFDLRQKFFSESLDFPLISQLPGPELDSYDFGRARARIAVACEKMQRFIGAIKRALGSPRP